MPVNLTPAHLRCSLGGCPSVHEMEDGMLRIIGKIDPSLTVNEDGSPIDPEKWDGIGQDETAIIISPDLLADYVAQVNGESLRDRAADELSPQERSSPCGSASLSQAAFAEAVLVPVLMEAARRGLPPDAQELLVHGCVSRGVPPGIILHMLRTAQRVVANSERDRNPKGGDLLGSVEDESPVCEANSPEILHLRSQLAKLKQALEPFKLWMDDLDKDFSDHEDDIVASGFGPHFVTFGDLRRARAALTEEDKEKCDSSPEGSQNPISKPLG